VQRSLARRSLADRLPGAVLAERGKGYQAADWYEGLRGCQDRLRAQVRQVQSHPQLRRLLDVDRMRRLVERWPADWSDPTLRGDYRLELMRALGAANFALSAENRASTQNRP
jgi:asparagine synthase (glutamine-hydrolysing)